jgi:hypothetical protein
VDAADGDGVTGPLTPERSARGAMLAWVAFGLTVLGTAAALFVPLGQECGETAVRPGEQPAARMGCRNVSFWTIGDGEAVALAGAIPILLAAVPLPLGQSVSGRRIRLGSAVLLSVFCAMALVSIGLFYLPAATVMWVAGAVRDGTPRRSRRVEPA